MHKKLHLRQQLILNYLENNKTLSSKELFEAVKAKAPVSKITINRDLNELLASDLITLHDRARATKYSLSPEYNILRPVNLKDYFSKEIDEREIKKEFNFQVFDLISKTQLFNHQELIKLNELDHRYNSNIKQLSPTILKKEFERVTIDLSWKSSRIEGNTYSLLETEALLQDGIVTEGKTKEEAIMILNHKNALNLVRENLEKFQELTIAKIETLHSVLTKDLDIPRNIRKTLVGITGTNYKPLDNEFQIREALEKMCQLINSLDNKFAKTMVTMLMISYIQPFEDGNKRTSRILSNAISLAHNSFPISFRTIDEQEYKEAILVFYEINNIDNFKRLFIEQAEFSVQQYFN